jgi:catechol 2,3-dioxygenase-like lactoylglutathione lyase family enzyme
MKIHLSSLFVDDQDKALAFYTDILGFEPRSDIPMGEFRWITIGNVGEQDGPQVSLEPDAHPAVPPFREALAADGIPMTSFAVESVEGEFARLTALGVVFTQQPMTAGPVTTAVFDDTCGNLIQIAEFNG